MSTVAEQVLRAVQAADAAGITQAALRIHLAAPANKVGAALFYLQSRNLVQVHLDDARAFVLRGRRYVRGSATTPSGSS